ncbi:MAG TPA: right-handed parallel beta-helix repeat-containing protein [Armatimonadota bacterium]
MLYLRRWLPLLAAAALCGAPAAAAILRVKADAAGPTHDGSSWSAAYLKVQDALTAASAGDEVWVAAGRYAENIAISKSIALYGGFAGAETARAQRDPAVNVSKLVSAANQRVVTIPAGADGSTLDGFTITRDVDASHMPFNGFAGGGVLVEASGTTISGNDIRALFANGNRGGILVHGLNAVIQGNVIADNTAWDYAITYVVLSANGGGICVDGGSATIRRNQISGCSAGAIAGTGGSDADTGCGGGGIMVRAGQAAIIGNRITGNAAVGGAVYLGFAAGGMADGGGISFVRAGGRIADNVIVGNVANATASAPPSPPTSTPSYAVTEADGAGIYVYRSNAIIQSNTIGANTASQESSTNGSVTTVKKGALEANIHWASTSAPQLLNNLILESDAGAAALFVDAANGDYRLLLGSPLIDAGDDAAVAEGDVDPDGAPRVRGQHVDVGAYEAAVGNVAVRLAWAAPVGDLEHGAFPSPPTACAVDASGNRVTSYANPITVSVKPGSGTPGTAVSGVSTLTPALGRVVYNGIGLDHTGAGFVLRASSGSLTPGDSNAFNFASQPTRVAFTVQPASCKQATPLSPAPTVAVLDDVGAIARDFSGPVTLAVKSGVGPTGATLFGTTSVAVSNGIAAFPNLYVDKAGAGYQLTAMASGLSSADSNPFDAAPIQMVYYVSPSGKIDNDGSSWDSAKIWIDAALSAAPLLGEVWVAAGTYYPETLAAEKAVYGGFRGNETRRDQRQPTLNASIIGFTTSVPAVLAPADSTARTIFDGFTITKGLGRFTRSGGTYSSIGVPNPNPHYATPTTIQYYAGGGVCVAGGAPVISHNIITGNGASTGPLCTSSDWMSGMCLAAVDNRTEKGAGVYVLDGAPSFVGNLIAGNVAYTDAEGDQVLVEGGQPRFIGNTIVGASSKTAFVCGATSSCQFANNIITAPTTALKPSGATQFSHNDVFPTPAVTPSPIGSDGNISAAPGFAEASTGNYRLTAGSPCLDAGDDAFVSVGDWDLSGDPTIWGTYVDMGCYEYQTVPPATMADVVSALRVAGGLDAASGDAYARANPLAGPIGIDDAVALARRMYGKN